MFNRIEIRTRTGSQLTLYVDDPSSGYIVEEIEGLDPVKAVLVSSSFSGANGEQYHSSRRETRNLRFRIALDPRYSLTSVEVLRKKLYSYFMPQSDNRFRFIDSANTVYEIFGRVESLETVLFDRESVVNISVICYNPDFYNPTPIQYTNRLTSTVASFTYGGNVETGIDFTLRPTSNLTQFTITHTLPNEEARTLEYLGPLSGGDVLRIHTTVGNKFATLQKASDGSVSSVLYAISPQSYWIQFHPGVNGFNIDHTGPGQLFDLQYVDRYGGL